jgi:hypothetical protein
LENSSFGDSCGSGPRWMSEIWAIVYMQSS